MARSSLLGRHALALLVCVVASPGCRCSKGAPEPARPGVADAGASALAPVVDASVPKLLGSLPIAAMLLDDDDVLVAALVPRTRTVDAAVLHADGSQGPAAPIVKDAAWTSDADLRLGGSAKSPLAVWRGLVGTKRARAGVVLSDKFLPVGEPALLEASHCTSKRHLAWLDLDGRRLVRRGVDATDKIVLPDVDPDTVIVCGADRQWVLTEREGEYDVGLGESADGGVELQALFRDSEISDDDTREVLSMTRGDEAVFLRVGQAGSLTLRVATSKVGPQRKLSTRVQKTDDVVASHAAQAGVIAVVTREDETSCDAGVASSRIAAVVVDAQKDSLVDVAPAACGVERGPFFANALADGSWTIAWVERAATRGRTTAPIIAVGHAILSPAGQVKTGSTPLSADGVADARCGAKRCAFVALVRPPNQDDAKPEELRAYFYP